VAHFKYLACDISCEYDDDKEEKLQQFHSVCGDFKDIQR